MKWKDMMIVSSMFLITSMAATIFNTKDHDDHQCLIPFPPSYDDHDLSLDHHHHHPRRSLTIPRPLHEFFKRPLLMKVFACC